MSISSLPQPASNYIWSEQFDWPRPIVSPEPEYLHEPLPIEETQTRTNSPGLKCMLSRIFTSSSISSTRRTDLPLQSQRSIPLLSHGHQTSWLGENGRRGKIIIDKERKVWVKQGVGRPKYLRVAWHGRGGDITDGDRCTYTVWNNGLVDMAVNVCVVCSYFCNPSLRVC